MDDDELLAQMLPILEIDTEYKRILDASDIETIAQIRRVGRRALHKLGHKAHTMQTDPARRSDGRVVVWVMAVLDDGPDLDLMVERGDLLVREAMQRHGLD